MRDNLYNDVFRHCRRLLDRFTEKQTTLTTDTSNDGARRQAVAFGEPRVILTRPTLYGLPG
jgi:hypothetical protein